MDTDLLSFNSPIVSRLQDSDTVSSNPKLSVSPGNNPFDDVIKKVSMEQGSKSNDSHIDQDKVSTSKNDRLESSIVKNSLPEISQNILDDVFKVPSISFSNCDSPFKLNTSFDIRRESMPFTFNELDLIDAGRPSLLFNQTFNFGRESLGILNLSSARESLLNLSARESLGILHHLPGLECGLTTDLNPPMPCLNEESTVEDSKASDSVQNCFNTAFLYPNIKQSVSSISSITSARSSFSSVNSAISEISKIYSLPSSMKSSDTYSMSRPNLLNDAFLNTNEYSKRFELSSLPAVTSPLKTKALSNIINSPELNNFRNKILSLPEPLKTDKESQDGLESAKKDYPKFWSAEKRNKRKAVVRQRSFCGALNFNEAEDVNFNDSVFIEANHLASRIANGSIVDSDPVTENILESTSPPELCEDYQDNEETEKTEKQATTYNEEAIFKVVDKMLPPRPNPNLDLKFSLKLKKSNTSKCNLSNTSNTSRKSTSINITKSSENSDKDNSSVNMSKRSNKSKEAKDLIYNLSEILNSTNKSEQQKSEGQQLLESLASILAQSPVNQNFNNMEDSGHSSLVLDTENDMNAANIEKHECYEVLDLRTSRSRSESDITNSTGNQEQPAALDLSVKASSNEKLGRRISLSFNLPRAKVLPSRSDSSVQSAASLELTNNNNSRPSVNGSLSSNSAGSFGSNRSSFCKLRTKRADEGAVKKGPLRAVIPLNSLMKKQKSYEQPSNKSPTLGIKGPATPKRLENLNSQNKKTSTPINHQSKLKPMAASTPDAQLSKMRSSMSHQKNVQNNVLMPPPNQLKAKTSSSNPVNNKRHSTVEKSLPKDKVSSSSSSVSSKSSLVKQRDSLSITGKPSLPLSTLRRHSVSDLKKNLEPNMRQKRSNSTGKEVGIMSALSRVRESITKSPFYKSSFGGSTEGSSVSKQSTPGLSENLRQSRNSNLMSSLKKYGKENKKL